MSNMLRKGILVPMALFLTIILWSTPASARMKHRLGVKGILSESTNPPTLRAGGTLVGSDVSGGNLLLHSTSDSTKGVVAINDGSFFVVDMDGSYVANGMPAYEQFALQVAGADGLTGIIIANHNSNGGAPNLVLSQTGGTWASPAYLNNNDIIGQIDFNVSNDVGADYIQPVSMQVFATEDHDASNQGAEMNFKTVKNGTTSLATRLQLSKYGFVRIPGALVTDPTGLQTITANNQVISTTNQSYLLLTSDNATPANRSILLDCPAGGGATTGQRLTIEWSGATNQGQLVDDSSASGCSARLAGTMAFDQYNTISLIFNGTDWIETSRSNN
jgi:hypothetical protein